MQFFIYFLPRTAGCVHLLARTCCILFIHTVSIHHGAQAQLPHTPEMLELKNSTYSIHGRVTAADDHTKGIAGVVVQAIARESVGGKRLVVSAITDRSGNYTISGLLLQHSYIVTPLFGTRGEALPAQRLVTVESIFIKQNFSLDTPTAVRKRAILLNRYERHEGALVPLALPMQLPVQGSVPKRIQDTLPLGMCVQ